MLWFSLSPDHCSLFDDCEIVCCVCLLGDAVSRIFIPQLIQLWQQGRFPFDKLITFYDGLEQLNKAVEDAHAGQTIKQHCGDGDITVMMCDAYVMCDIAHVRRKS